MNLPLVLNVKLSLGLLQLTTCVPSASKKVEEYYLNLKNHQILPKMKPVKRRKRKSKKKGLLSQFR